MGKRLDAVGSGVMTMGKVLGGAQVQEMYEHGQTTIKVLFIVAIFMGIATVVWDRALPDYAKNLLSRLWNDKVNLDSPLTKLSLTGGQLVAGLAGTTGGMLWFTWGGYRVFVQQPSQNSYRDDINTSKVRTQNHEGKPENTDFEAALKDLKFYEGYYRKICNDLEQHDINKLKKEVEECSPKVVVIHNRAVDLVREMGKLTGILTLENDQFSEDIQKIEAEIAKLREEIRTVLSKAERNEQIVLKDAESYLIHIEGEIQFSYVASLKYEELNDSSAFNAWVMQMETLFNFMRPHMNEDGG